MADEDNNAINWRLIWKTIKAIFSFLFKTIWAVFSYTICFMTLWIMIGILLFIYVIIAGNINFELWFGLLQVSYPTTILYVLIFPDKWLKFFNTHVKEKKKDPWG